MLYRAGWILPISKPPIRGGFVGASAGRIVSVSADAPDVSSLAGRVETVDLGNVAILPGLVNAHTHLELSWMRNRIPPSDATPVWASKLMALRREQGSDPPQPIVDAIRE